MSRHYFYALVALVLATTACERSEPAQQPVAAASAEVADANAEPGDADADADADAAMEQTRECVNREDGYAIGYPATWHTNAGSIMSACSLFDPGPIEVPENSEIPPSIAVMIDIEPVAFTTVTGEVLGRHETVRGHARVAGRNAVQMDAQSTGAGLYDRGMRSYSYFIDLGTTTMIASTHDAGDLPFERKRRILDAMMETLEFRGRTEPQTSGE